MVVLAVIVWRVSAWLVACVVCGWWLMSWGIASGRGRAFYAVVFRVLPGGVVDVFCGCVKA